MTTAGRLHAINVSRGGVPKHGRASAQVSPSGVEGDSHLDQRSHGGPNRAVLLYSLERLLALQAEGHPIVPGAIGENFTVAGLDWDEIRPGVRLQIGGVLVEMTVPASPCLKIADAFVNGEFVRVSDRVHPGWSRYCARVLMPGRVEVGDAVHVVTPGYTDRRLS
jgi:MOSC domain-containing protein YiiM